MVLFFLPGGFKVCKYILGIDISKSTFDIALLDDDDNFATGQFKNSQHGVRSLQKWLLRQCQIRVRHDCGDGIGGSGPDYQDA